MNFELILHCNQSTLISLKDFTKLSELKKILGRISNISHVFLINLVKSFKYFVSYVCKFVCTLFQINAILSLVMVYDVTQVTVNGNIQHNNVEGKGSKCLTEWFLQKNSFSPCKMIKVQQCMDL